MNRETLYKSGLAYQLFDKKGYGIHASLIPALLPYCPVGLEDIAHVSSRIKRQDKRIERSVEEFSKHLLPTGCVVSHTIIVTLSLLPTTFTAQSQVKLQKMAQLGGAWKSGCVLNILDSNDYLILFVDEEKVVFIVAGNQHVAEIMTIDTILQLLKRQKNHKLGLGCHIYIGATGSICTS